MSLGSLLSIVENSKGKIRIKSFFKKEDVVILAEVLKTNTTIQELYLQKTRFGLCAQSIDCFAKALSENSSLQKLDLSYNKIQDEEAKLLFQALEKNVGLKYIKLEENGIGNESIKSLAHFLKENTSLQKINLACNNIDDEGVKCLAQALKFNKTLKAINLDCHWDCNRGSEGIDYLIDTLEHNTTLTSVILKYTLKSERLIELLEINKRQDVEGIKKKVAKRSQYFITLWKNKEFRLLPRELRYQIKALSILFGFDLGLKGIIPRKDPKLPQLPYLPLEMWYQIITEIL